MLTWISENAKWVIYLSIAGIVAGLLFMDMSSLQFDNRPPVGVVNGENLSYDMFEIRLRQIQSQQSGLSEEQASQMRDELFRSFVQQHLMQKALDKVKIKASVYEMKRDLRNEPPQGIDREPTFHTDGVFDFAKYEAWLSNPETYDIPFMQEYEKMLKNAKIPEKQLRVFIGAGAHPSTLEAKYNVLNRETKFELWNAQGNAKAFEEITISESTLDSVFKAQLDSFFLSDDLVKVRYVAIPVEPSKKDIESTLEYAEMQLNQIKEGTDFGELARNISDDSGSDQQGGELGDYGPRGRWVPEFDSAAFALDSGAVSNPVRTQFGYHIIQSLGKRIENGEEQVKARHILISVAATSETTDSLIEILHAVKADVDAGKKLEEAAQARNLTPELSNWFKRGGDVSVLGHISGLSSYAFFNPLRPRESSKTSDVMQNSKWVVIFQKADSLSSGSRSFEFAKPKIEQNLKAKARSAAIASFLSANLEKLSAITELNPESKTSIENIAIDSATVSFESYLPGLGYATPELYSALANAKENAWSGPFTSGQNAVMLKVLSKNIPSKETLESAINDEMSMAWQYGTFSAFSDYMKNLEASAKVVNNLDLYHRE